MERSDSMPNNVGQTDEPLIRPEIDELTQAVPARLADFMASLVYLAPSGQEHALQALGPGSRLVLEALRLVDVGAPPQLTERGRLAAERLADAQAQVSGPVVGSHRSGTRLRRIARVLPVHERDVVAASTATEEQSDEFIVTYELSPEPGSRPDGGGGAKIEVARNDQDFWIWQRGGPDTVVVLESMEPLPVSDDPVVVANPDGQPPSVLLRRLFGLSEESDG